MDWTGKNENPDIYGKDRGKLYELWMNVSELSDWERRE